jgi:hypothetical protein
MSEESLILKTEAEPGRICLLTGKEIKPASRFESVSEIKCPTTGATIRFWRKKPAMPEYAEEEILMAFNLIPGGVSMPDVIDILSSFAGVTKIELIDANGCGGVAYFE